MGQLACVQQEQAEQLGEAEGHDGEVVLAQPQGGGADEQARRHREHDPGRHRHPEVDTGQGEEGGGVGAEGVEGDVAEVHEAGDAVVQGEAQGEQGLDADDRRQRHEVLGHAVLHSPRGRNMRQSAIATKAIASLYAEGMISVDHSPVRPITSAPAIAP